MSRLNKAKKIKKGVLKKYSFFYFNIILRKLNSYDIPVGPQSWIETLHVRTRHGLGGQTKPGHNAGTPLGIGHLTSPPVMDFNEFLDIFFRFFIINFYIGF